ncbi:MAG: hypothetical protein ACRD6W_15780, partial [Nitrososphaerales archaeon]
MKPDATAEQEGMKRGDVTEPQQLDEKVPVVVPPPLDKEETETEEQAKSKAMGTGEDRGGSGSERPTETEPVREHPGEPYVDAKASVPELGTAEETEYVEIVDSDYEDSLLSDEAKEGSIESEEQAAAADTKKDELESVPVPNTEVSTEAVTQASEAADRQEQLETTSPSDVVTHEQPQPSRAETEGISDPSAKQQGTESEPDLTKAVEPQKTELKEGQEGAATPSERKDEEPPLSLSDTTQQQDLSAPVEAPKQLPLEEEEKGPAPSKETGPLTQPVYPPDTTTPTITSTPTTHDNVEVAHGGEEEVLPSSDGTSKGQEQQPSEPIPEPTAKEEAAAPKEEPPSLPGLGAASSP